MDPKPMETLCLDPELRLCPVFDEYSIRFDPELPSNIMGVRVVDNCPEEHMM